MQTVTGRPATHSPKWVLLAAMGLFGIFLGIGIRQVVAQTSTFVDPTCTPPGTCNTSAPLFLHPNNLTATQRVDTPVQIGQSGAYAKDLSLFGSLTLSEPGKVIQTAASYNEDSSVAINIPVIDFLTKSTFPVIKVNNSGTGAGIQATATSGNAIYASNAGGNAALFDGPVVINNTGTGLTVNGPLTLAGIAGNLSVAGTLTVNGNSITGTNKIVTSSIPANTSPVPPTIVPGTKTLNLQELIFGTGHKYTLTGLQILYKEKTGAETTKKWLLFPNDKVEYLECESAVYKSDLTLVNPLVVDKIADVRVVAQYTEDPVDCEGDTTIPVLNFDALPVDVSNSYVSEHLSNFYLSTHTTPRVYTWGGTAASGANGTISASATDTQSGISKIEIETKSGSTGTYSSCGTSSTESVTCTWDTATSTTSAGTIRYVKVTATNGAGLTASNEITVYVDNNAPLVSGINPNLATVIGRVGLYATTNSDNLLWGSGIGLTKFYWADLTSIVRDVTHYIGSCTGPSCIVNWNAYEKANGSWRIVADVWDNTDPTGASTRFNSFIRTYTVTHTCGTTPPATCSSNADTPQCCLTPAPACYDPIIYSCCSMGIYNPITQNCCAEGIKLKGLLPCSTGGAG